jgi:predicted nuclease of predicted toxin-antitoxin system
MRLLADENIDAAIIEWLRSMGEDVLSATEKMRSAEDVSNLHRASSENRIVLTKDMDFGELVFHGRLASAGVILLRFKTAGADLRLSIVKRHWRAISRYAHGNFVVVSEDRLRIRKFQH